MIKANTLIVHIKQSKARQGQENNRKKKKKKKKEKKSQQQFHLPTFHCRTSTTNLN
jgi:hypothetical protein